MLGLFCNYNEIKRTIRTGRKFCISLTAKQIRSLHPNQVVEDRGGMTH